MRSTLFVALLALLAGGVALALTLGRGTGSGTSGTPSASPDQAQGRVELERRIGELELGNRSLRDRLALLESSPLPTPDAERAAVVPTFATREELDELRAELLARLGGTSTPGAGSPEAVQALVARSLEEIRLEEAREASERKVDARVQRLEESMPKIERWLDLRGDQTERLQEAVLARIEREAEVARRVLEGADPEWVREQKQLDHEAHQAELAEVLTPEQLETLGQNSGWIGK